MKSLKTFILENNEMINGKGISFNELDFIEITSLQQLSKLLKETKTNVQKKTGFWLFLEALEKDKRSYANIKKEPWFIEYCCLSYNGTPIGLISYSLTHGEDDDRAEQYKPNLYILDIQTLPQYKGFLSHYFKFLENKAKENQKDYLILMCYEPSLERVYAKYGFEKVENENLMFKKIIKTE